MGNDHAGASLKGIYESTATLREAWLAERSAITAILDALARALEGQFEIVDALGVGGAGVVLRVRDVELGVMRALKFARPSPDKQALLAAVLSSESERLASLSHPNIMNIHSRGTVTAHEAPVPFYVMDLYEGYLPLGDFVKGGAADEATILELLERTTEAIAYVHSRDHVHLDIKPDNILVGPDRRPVLIDFGFAKVLKDESAPTTIGGTEGYIHPEARAFIAEASSDPNRLRGEAARREVKTTWDLFALGKTILRVLELVAKRPGSVLTRYTYRYLKLMGCRMLDGHNLMTETVLGLSLQAYEELRYSTAEEALLDLRKLTGSYNLESRIPELNQFQPDTIQVSTFATTPFTPRVKSLFEHSEVAHLGSFTQLSLLNLVFPTATHTRLEHAIGTFSAMTRYVAALSRDATNPIFRQIMREEDLLAALVVALVHDIGHFSLAHDLEDVDKAVFSHEARGIALLEDSSTGLKGEIEARSIRSGAPGWGVPVERIVAILQADVRKMTGSIRDRIIHAMIDGPIDADKLDYIIRDSANLGLPYGSVIDVERLLRVLTVVTRQSGDATYVSVGIHEKGRVTAEAVAFARYALYGSVYWHHGYRSVKAMIHRIGLEYLERVEESDRQRKAGVAKAAQRDLYPFLRAVPPSGNAQLPLGTVGARGQLHPGDAAMLEWLAERSGAVGRGLVTNLEERRLFKRVMVVSRWGNEHLWQAVTDAVTDRRRQGRLRFQRDFQGYVLEAVERDGAAATQSVVLPADARNRFISAASAGVVLLVDATQARPGAGGALEIIQEEDRRRQRIDEIPATRPEESTMWETIRDHLHRSLGKVRVFCDPEHALYISSLDRHVLEDALDRAARTE